MKQWSRRIGPAAVVLCALSLIATAGADPALAAAKKTRRAAKTATSAPKPAPVPTAAEEWSKAMGLSDQQRYDEALEVIRGALVRYPDDTDLTWLEASVTGWAGRNRESVELFEKLVRKHPELARDTRLDLATQRLWAGDPRGALRGFDLRLEENPTDQQARRLRALALAHADRLAEAVAAYDALLAEHPEDVELALWRAEALTWMGRHAQAAQAYQEILRRDPQRNKARLGLAQNENWRGNHLLAARMFEDLLDQGEDDPEVSKGLAFAYFWSDRLDRSRSALDHFLTRHPQDREGRELAGMLARGLSRNLTVGYGRSDDSDALRVRETTVEYHVPWGGRRAVTLLWQKYDVQDGGGSRDPLRIGASLDHTWSLAWSGRFRFAYFQSSESDDPVGLGGVSLVHRRSDRVRLEGGYTKESVVTRRALASEVRVGTLHAGLDWRMGDRASFHLGQQLRNYNDENRATLRSALLRARVKSEPRWRLAVTLGVDHLKSHLNLDGGYYSPERYIEYGPGLEWEWEPKPRWNVSFDGQIGWQREKFAESDPFQQFTATAEAPLGNVLALTLVGGRSDSNLSSDSGFEQKHWAAFLTRRF